MVICSISDAGTVKLAVVTELPAQLVSSSRRMPIWSLQDRSTCMFPTSPGGNIEGVVNTLPVPKQSISVKELAAQIDVPLISGRAFAQEVGVGAARSRF